MSSYDKKARTTLTDGDIKTERKTGRRGFLGLVAAGGAAGATMMAATPAAAADNDLGNWTDAVSCPRGLGGVYTGVTDADSGSQYDDPGYGRGLPYC
jgi:cyanophycinase-like exopeptidase